MALVALAGCVSQSDDGSAWEDVSAMSGALAPEVGPTPGALRAPTCSVRVVSWNVHLGADVEDLARRIRASAELARADVLLLQEIEAYPGEGLTRTSRLAAALDMTWIYAPARLESDGTHGLAILSRFPLEDAQVRQLPYFEQPLNPRNRVALATDVVLGPERLRVIDVHLDLRLGIVDRIRQLHPAVNDIPDRVLVGGDFNTNPWAWFDGLVPLTGTEAIVGQEQASVIDDYLGGKGFASALSIDDTTVRLPGFAMRIDNFYARGLAIDGARVEHVEGSDHWPLWVDVDVCN